MSFSPFPDALPSVETINAQRRPGPRHARRRARRGLRPIEADLLARYREWCGGTVLELSCRGDGLTAALIRGATDFTGVCDGGAELVLCRRRFPGVRFELAETLDLDDLILAEFDVVVAGRCGLDHLGDVRRRERLVQIGDLLARDGLLIFSSHNLERESRLPGPGRHLLGHPWLIGQFPRARANRARLRGLQERGRGYGIFNHPEAAFGRLAYYVSRDGQARQLADSDLILRECLDRSGRLVPALRHAAGERELHYVAVRATAWL